MSRARRRPLDELVKIALQPSRPLLPNVYDSLLRRCGESRALREGELVHSHILAHGAISPSLADALVQMYGRCGSVGKARTVFDSMQKHRTGTFSWNLMIGAYSRNGHFAEAIELFRSMNNCVPDGFTFSSLLAGCSSVAEGEITHRWILLHGLHDSHAAVSVALIDMYCRFDRVNGARAVFDRAAGRNVVVWNAMISRYAQSGCCKEALRLFDEMVALAIDPDGFTFSSVLSACSSLGDLHKGSSVHAMIIASSPRLEDDVFVKTALINMYAKSCRIDVAKELFDGMLQRNVVTWNTMIAAYAQTGRLVDAVDLFDRIDVAANSVTFVNALTACANFGGSFGLAEGKKVHERFLRSGLKALNVETCLVNMYAKCGDLGLAQGIFESMSKRNVVAWNAMIGGFTQQGHPRKAIELYDRMDIQPDAVTYLTVFSACSSLGDLECGSRLHQGIQQKDLADAQVQAALISMYGRCGRLDLARHVFERYGKRSSSCWNAMLAAYAHQGQGNEALDLYDEMVKEPEEAAVNSVTYACLLGACAIVGDFQRAKELHALAAEEQLIDMNVQTAALNMYARFGRLDIARQIFDQMCRKDVVAWNAMVSAYAQNGQGVEALGLYSKMNLEGVHPDCGTFVNVLAACSALGNATIGRTINDRVLAGHVADVDVWNALITMYAKCGCLHLSEQVFGEASQKDVVSWNALLTAYVQDGQAERALELYDSMRKEGIVQPDSITLALVFGACSCSGRLEKGIEIHGQLDAVDDMVSSALVSMYSSFRQLDAAEDVFARWRENGRVTWNAMISAYAQNGREKEALRLLGLMDLQGLAPDKVTFSSLISACGNLGNLKQGVKLHARCTEMGCISSLVEAALVSMYAKCGRLGIARRIFDHSCLANLLCWTCIVSAYAQHGHGQLVVELYERMMCEGIRPDSVAFVSILVGCSHSGLLKEGVYCFRSMLGDHSLKPWMEHYAAMVDLLARSGRLELTRELIATMPFEPDLAAWTSLLGACSVHGDGKHGRGASSSILELSPAASGPYVLMSNMQLRDVC